jgi:hypothetical protein
VSLKAAVAAAVAAAARPVSVDGVHGAGSVSDGRQPCTG